MKKSFRKVVLTLLVTLVSLVFMVSISIPFGNLTNFDFGFAVTTEAISSAKIYQISLDKTKHIVSNYSSAIRKGIFFEFTPKYCGEYVVSSPITKITYIGVDVSDYFSEVGFFPIFLYDSEFNYISEENNKQTEVPVTYNLEGGKTYYLGCYDPNLSYVEGEEDIVYFFDIRISKKSDKLEWRDIEVPCTVAPRKEKFCTACGTIHETEIYGSAVHTDTDLDGTCDKCEYVIETITLGQGKDMNIATKENSMLKFIPTESGEYRFNATPASLEGYHYITNYVYDSSMKLIGQETSGGSDWTCAAFADLTAGETYYVVTEYYPDDDYHKGTFNIRVAKNYYECDHRLTTYNEGTPATCTEDGFTEGIFCEICLCWIEGHDVIYAGHKIGDWTIDREAGCLNDGSKYKACTVCGKIFRRAVIPATGHDYVDEVVPPACLVSGYTKHDCLNCDHHYEENFTAATGHTNGKWITVNEATCENVGFKYQECSVCRGLIKGENIPTVGHRYEVMIILPTCVTPGQTNYRCLVCDKKYSDSYVNPLGHTPTEWIVDYDSTCTKKGAKHKECKTCGVAIDNEEIALKAHTYKTIITKATPTEDGSKVTECTACGAKKSESVIYKPSSIKLSTTKYTYNGKVKTPTVTVKDSEGNTLKKGTDYTVKYASDRKNVGVYTVTVIFKGNYSGQEELRFTIVPKATAKITATQTTNSITVKWSKVAGATGYNVYLYGENSKRYFLLGRTSKTSYTIKNLKAGTNYTVKIIAYKGNYRSTAKSFVTATKPATPKISKATAGKGTATVVWNNLAGESGYEVYYSTKKSSGYKKAATTKANTVKTTVKKLKKGTTYYFKVRAYKKVGSSYVYSSWSNIKSVKVK